MNIDLDTQRAKTIARAVAQRCKSGGAEIAYGQALDGLAAGLGFTDWNHLAARLKADEQPIFTRNRARLSWVWSSASEPNGFAETIYVTPEAARKVKDMLDVYRQLSGDIANVQVDLDRPEEDPSGITAALRAFEAVVVKNGLFSREDLRAIHAEIKAIHGAPDEPNARERALVAYQMNPAKAGEPDRAFYMEEMIVRLSAAERTYVQAFLNRVAGPDRLNALVWDICVGPLPFNGTEPTQPGPDDGTADAIALASDYIADQCPGDDVPDQMRKAFGAFACQDAIDHHQAKWSS